jgi:hypothetical protein
MPDFLLIKIIQNIDKQIGLLDVETVNLKEVSQPLINLRNNLLREFVCKNTKTDWSIKEHNALLILKKINYVPSWC